MSPIFRVLCSFVHGKFGYGLVRTPDAFLIPHIGLVPPSPTYPDTHLHLQYLRASDCGATQRYRAVLRQTTQASLMAAQRLKHE